MPRPSSDSASLPFVLFADWHHQGELQPLPPSIAPPDFVIVPLLPFGDTAHDAPAVLRIETHIAGTSQPPAPGMLEIRVEEESVRQRVHLLERAVSGPESQWKSRGAGGQWRLLAAGPGSATEVGLAAHPGSGADPAALTNRFTVSIGLVGLPETMRQRFFCRVAPVLLASSLDPVETVLVVRNHLTAGFADTIARLVPQCEGAPSLHGMDFETVPNDVWMQDTVEIGRAPVPGPQGAVQQAVAPLRGLRAKHDGIHTAPLDAFVADQLARLIPGAVCITPAAPREHTRWIDWYGNLEVSPPVERFSCGRILVGRQKELGMHPDLMAFLEAQEAQWPPLVLDVSWLTIGHVDELVNFVPAKGRPGFRVVLPSPDRARRLLEFAVKSGHGDAAVFAGKESQTTVRALLREVADTPETEAIERALADARAQLKEGLGVTDKDIIALPALYKKGLAVIPSGVNSLVVGSHVFIPDPVGPVIEGEDIFRRATRESLAPLGLTLHFLDIWEPYHVRSGEIHCGTNAIRRLANPFWWKATHLEAGQKTP